MVTRLFLCPDALTNPSFDPDVTTYVESATCVAEGGRTGLTAVIVGVLFFASLFLSPIFASIPSATTAPALIIVGVMMITPIKDIDYDDFTEAIPAFLTMIFMLCASNMADGIMMGILSYVLLKFFTGRRQEMDKMTYAIAAFYLLKIILEIILSIKPEFSENEKAPRNPRSISFMPWNSGTFRFCTVIISKQMQYPPGWHW